MTLKKVKLFANLREAAKASEVELFGNTISELLEDLDHEYPALRDLVFENGKLRSYINILVNGDNIEHLEGIDTEIFDTDEIAMFPPVSGG
jgi:molybdopterin synthase sulfur carrier subunit